MDEDDELDIRRLKAYMERDADSDPGYDSDDRYPVAERFVQAEEPSTTQGKPCGVWGVMDIPTDEAQPAETPSADTNVIMRMGDEYEVNATDECEKSIYIALDSGSVAHVASPKHVPDAAVVDAPPEGCQPFVAANGGTMANHGTTTLHMVSEDDGNQMMSTLNLTDSTRALHSCTMMADQGNEILMTKSAAMVVPEGFVDRVIALMAKEGKRVRATYPRRGGLYVARMRARPGARPTQGLARNAAGQFLPRPAAARPGAPRPKAKAQAQPKRGNSGFTRRGGQR